MAALARRERAALADLLDDVGPAAPTLSGSWTTFDLTAHLVLREAAPWAAVGVVVPALERVTDRGMEWLKTKYGYTELVRRLRNGPPWYSPLRPSKIDAAANALEFFIHHEDVRRGGGTGKPRELSHHDQHVLWAAVRRMGRLLARNSPVGIELVRSDVPGSLRISKGEPTLVVRGLPSELALFAYGRGAVADVETSGDAEAVEALTNDQLGL